MLVSSQSIGHNIAQRFPWALYKAPFHHRRTTASDKSSNVRPARAQAIWPLNALTAHIAQSASPDLTRSNNVSTICSTARRLLQFARSSLETPTHCRTSVNPTEIGIMSEHGHRIVSAMMMITAERMTATATTSEGDQTTSVTVTAMTTIEQTMIMTGMTTTGMIGII